MDAMFDIVRASLRTGRVTTAYPDQPECAPAAFRGRPTLEPKRCDGAGQCVESCPANAITLRYTAAAPYWQLDLARCVFCGLCEEACPNQAIRLTNDFELAARRRAELRLSVPLTTSRSAESGPRVPQASARDQEALAVVQAEVERLTDRIRTLLRRSLHIRHMDAGSDNSTDWELSALLNPVYDLQRLGLDIVASPRHADLLLVTGAVTRNLALALRRTYEAMPQPCLVVAAGAEACGGGVLQGAYAVAGGVDQCLPVDVYIPGDPPRPLALIQGLLVAMGKLEPKLLR
jgi:Ni,Fe-hydrogenase III small subunit/formate hydrogenlyase subunit 6/NADH:ubiquinone oxidoreductase subunit I